MKRFCILTLCLFLLSAECCFADMRGAWVSTVHNIDLPEKNQQAAYIDTLYKMKRKGLNTVVFQVRPSGDATYDSEFVPRSPYVDESLPLEYLIEEAHDLGMEFHAWFNPYRVTVSSNSEPLNHFKREWLIKCDGNYYLNPGLPEVRKYLRDVIYEVLVKYDIDAVHFDDYFYPNGNFDDSKTYEKYGNGKSLGDWRRDNVNTFVYNIGRLTSKFNVEFGISPSGIWRNDSNDKRGSRTSGFSSYDDIYADSLYWVEHGYIDYIAPQIYWSKDSKAAPFNTVLDWWVDAVANTDVKLYVGIGIYKDEVKKEVKEQTKSALNHTDGVIYFSARDIDCLPL